MTASQETPGSVASMPAHKSHAAKRHEEHQYLDLVQEILDNGEHRPDR
jgi:thymidylate synthase